MAVWVHQDATLEPRVAEERILRSILAIAEIAGGLSERFALPFPLRIGAGVDRGEVVVGNFGGEGSADHTALGPAVNRAFRLEAATRSLNCDILLSSSAYQPWQESFPALRFRVEHVSLKGFPEETTVYAGSFTQLREIVTPSPRVQDAKNCAD